MKGDMKADEVKEILDVAAGRKKAELVLKNVEIVNTLTEEIEKGDIAVHRGIIAGVGRYSGVREIDCSSLYAVPALIDAHTHIEMSMLTVSEFARLVVPRGTTSVIADPHEIANVLGSEGVKLILEEAKHTPLKVYCMIPSCVPSSPLETSGGRIDEEDIRELLKMDNVLGLAEVMNFPGVVNGEDDILAKIFAARGHVIDGHFPCSDEYWLNAYISAGIMSDHENVDIEGARRKLRRGMWVMIREGSAARNLHALRDLAKGSGSRRAMLVTDGDRAVADIIREGYLDHVFRRAVEEGIDPIRAVQMLTLNPAEYYGLNAGMIAPGKAADIVLLRNLERFEVSRVLVDGKDPEFGRFEYPEFAKNTVKARKIRREDVRVKNGSRLRVIEVVDGEIVTEESTENVEGMDVNSSEELRRRDVLKAVVVERHTGSGRVGVAFVRGFGLKKGAIAQSIAHDAHNIVSVGVGDEDICKAVNAVIDMQGGIAVFDGAKIKGLQLRIAGIMSDAGAEEVAERLDELHEMVSGMGCRLRSPFIALSFIALPVIPKLKVTDLGLVDVERFEVVEPVE